MTTNVRATAARVVSGVMNGSSLPDALAKTGCTGARDAALLREICYGTIRHFFSLSAVRDALLKRPLRKKDTLVSALLLTGLYQLTRLSIPAYAAVAETVSAAEALQRPDARALINAVLRNFTRNPDVSGHLKNDIARFDHPVWLIHKLQQQYPECWQALLTQNNMRAPVTLRVNGRKISRENYLRELTSRDPETGQAVVAQQTPLSAAGITLRTPVDVTRLPGFTRGLVSVQDEGAQLAAVLLNCNAGDRVLDACAAPGGKTCHIKELVPEVTLTAVDSDPGRLAKVQDNLKRTGGCAQLICGDATDPQKWHPGGTFERILLDVPCSATGVIRRHPDIKLLRRAEDIAKLSAVQDKMLQKLWPLLTPGGLLVYATCSVLREENDDRIRQFLRSFHNAVLLPPPALYRQFSTPCGFQLLPQQGGHGGFFYSILQKRTE